MQMRMHSLAGRRQNVGQRDARVVLDGGHRPQLSVHGLGLFRLRWGAAWVGCWVRAKGACGAACTACSCTRAAWSQTAAHDGRQQHAAVHMSRACRCKAAGIAATLTRSVAAATDAATRRLQLTRNSECLNTSCFSPSPNGSVMMRSCGCRAHMRFDECIASAEVCTVTESSKAARQRSRSVQPPSRRHRSQAAAQTQTTHLQHTIHQQAAYYAHHTQRQAHSF